jgi:hypothetical protein
MKYDSYTFRTEKEYRDKLTSKEKELMLILMTFGATVDPHGYDDGDYEEAMKKLKTI